MLDRSSVGWRARAALAPLALVLALALAGPAGAQGVPGVDANRCLAGKNKCVAQKIAGLMRCRAKCQRKPDKCGQVQTDCEAKVMDKFDGGLIPARGCFARLEAKLNLADPASVCTTTGDTAAMEVRVDGVVSDLVATLEGNPPPTCGDGVVDGAESCDSSDLGGATCASLGFGSGTLACTAGCGYDVSGCSSCYPGVRFVDRGLTVLDCDTGLEWEKKTAGNVDDLHTWTATPNGSAPDGTAFTTFLPAVAAALGGTVCPPSDCTSEDDLMVSCTTPPPDGCWRLPEIDELQTILDCGAGAPCIDSIFGPTASSFYWSATSWGVPFIAWFVNFDNGNVNRVGKDFGVGFGTGMRVRAVRGGS